MAEFKIRPIRLLSSLLAVALLVSPSAEAQRKKPKKKPVAGATAKPKAARAAPAPAPQPAPAAEPAAPEPEPEPEPAPPKKNKSPKVEEAEAPAPENPEEDRGVSEKEKGTKTSAPLIDVEIGLKGFQRHLAYQNDVNNVLPNYDLSGAPAIAIDVGVYPIHAGSFSAGVTGSFESAFSIGTTYKDPQPGQEGTHSTSANAYAFGARGNYNFGHNLVGIGVEYGAQNYKVDLPPPTPDNAQVPDVEYRFVRPNVSARLGLSDSVALMAGFGYLYIMSAGEIVSEAYFRGPITTASGFDVNLGLGWAPISSLKAFEIRPTLGWRRIAFTFKPDPTAGDIYIADGAHDDYLSLAMMFGLRM
jgi:hypothetical protein